ncbi:hypothetical protein ACLOJK_036352, partial [Asimina triloba]
MMELGMVADERKMGKWGLLLTVEEKFNCWPLDDVVWGRTAVGCQLALTGAVVAMGERTVDEGGIGWLQGGGWADGHGEGVAGELGTKEVCCRCWLGLLVCCRREWTEEIAGRVVMGSAAM